MITRALVNVKRSSSENICIRFKHNTSHMMVAHSASFIVINELLFSFHFAFSEIDNQIPAAAVYQ